MVLSFEAGKLVNEEVVNALVNDTKAGHMGYALSYHPKPKVSVDFDFITHSSIFASEQTKVTDGRMVRVLAWYDSA